MKNNFIKKSIFVKILSIVMLIVLIGCNKPLEVQFKALGIKGFIESYENEQTLIQFPVVYTKAFSPKPESVKNVTLIGDNVEMIGIYPQFIQNETTISKDYNSAMFSFFVEIPKEGQYRINKIDIEFSDGNIYENNDVELKIISLKKNNETNILDLKGNTMRNRPEFDMNFTFQNTSNNDVKIDGFSYDNELFSVVKSEIYYRDDLNGEPLDLVIPKSESRTIILNFETNEDLSNYTILVSPSIMYSVDDVKYSKPVLHSPSLIYPDITDDFMKNLMKN